MASGIIMPRYPALAKKKALVLIDRTTGTNIGNMTSAGGLAAAFDGVTSQTSASCALLGSATNAFVGKTLAASRAFGQAVVFGSNNAGYVAGAGTPAVTLTVYGKQGAAPSSGTNGTALGSISFSDTSNESTGRTIASTDLGTVWDHLWIYVAQGGSAANMFVAELQLYAWE